MQQRLFNKPVLLHGDCLELMKDIPDGSVDLILTDLPYGTVTDIASGDTVRHGMAGKTKWDNVIDTSEIMKISNRILRKNGRMVLFAQQPFTTELINNTLPNLPFSYSMIWIKDHFANGLLAKKAPVNYYEDVLVFSKNNPKHDFGGAHPLRGYFLAQKQIANLTYGKVKKILGNGMGVHYFTNGSQFYIPTLKNYKKLQTTGFFKREWQELKAIDTQYRTELRMKMNGKYPRTFNLWEGNKFKSNILKYKKDYGGHHPTQKPVRLLEDLIKTFSNGGDTVVDMTMGSGSTGVACNNTGRKFIGIELDDKYYQIAKERINAQIGE